MNILKEFWRFGNMNGAYKGRGLFFPETSNRLVLLVVFRKATAKTPAGLINLAINRKHKYEKDHGNQ
jgi:phage-related protein